MSQFIENVNNLVHDASLMLSLGFITLILGILMVVAHNIWQWNWRVIVTILAWLTLIKGLSILYVPQYIDALSLAFIASKKTAYIGACFDLLLGIVLCYTGFKSEHPNYR
jgi:phosphoglycerol transferase MdoB-like AlkP superfamily enzyme